MRLDRPIHASVAVHLVGGEDAPGVREGGVLSQPLREINVEALPLEVPEHLELDVSHMGMGDTLRLADIIAPAGVTLLDDLETVVGTVTAPTREEEPEEGVLRGRTARLRGRRRRIRAGGDASGDWSQPMRPTAATGPRSTCWSSVRHPGRSTRATGTTSGTWSDEPRAGTTARGA